MQVVALLQLAWIAKATVLRKTAPMTSKSANREDTGMTPASALKT
jgi:hypothetical protein